MGIVNLFGCKASRMTAEMGTRDIMYIELLSDSKSALNILDCNFIAGPIQTRSDGLRFWMFHSGGLWVAIYVELSINFVVFCSILLLSYT